MARNLKISTNKPIIKGKELLKTIYSSLNQKDALFVEVLFVLEDEINLTIAKILYE